MWLVRRDEEARGLPPGRVTGRAQPDCAIQCSTQLRRMMSVQVSSKSTTQQEQAVAPQEHAENRFCAHRSIAGLFKRRACEPGNHGSTNGARAWH
jgi:hypothetical protein